MPPAERQSLQRVLNFQDAIRDTFERLLQISNNSSDDMKFKSNEPDMKVAVESLIDDHVFPLTHRAMLREDWGRVCTLLS